MSNEDIYVLLLINSKMPCEIILFLKKMYSNYRHIEKLNTFNIIHDCF